MNKIMRRGSKENRNRRSKLGSKAGLFEPDVIADGGRLLLGKGRDGKEFKIPKENLALGLKISIVNRWIWFLSWPWHRGWATQFSDIFWGWPWHGSTSASAFSPFWQWTGPRRSLILWVLSVSKLKASVH